MNDNAAVVTNYFVPCFRRKASTSGPLGIEGCAPGRVTEIAATAEAKTALRTTVDPRIRRPQTPR
jgi:hypothetical protein